jgi:hypothetical protein
MLFVCLLQSQFWSRVSLLRVAMGGIWNRRECCKVVEPVQAGLMGDGIDAAEEKVDIVRLS